MPELRIYPHNDPQVDSVEIWEDAQTGELKCLVKFKDGSSMDVFVVEFDTGLHGTWARLLLPDGRQFCITQSAKMPPACYWIEGEQIPIPDEPTVPEEVVV